MNEPLSAAIVITGNPPSVETCQHVVLVREAETVSELHARIKKMFSYVISVSLCEVRT